MTTSSRSFRRGDVVLVPFPFTDLSSAKPRPAFILSVDAYNASGSDVVIAAITSNVVAPRPFEHLVARWREAGLLRPSVVKAVVSTIHQSLIHRRLGQLPESDQTAVDRKLRGFLGL